MDASSLARKLLEEDEVESMHSGAAVEALTAALNRDIGMDVPVPSVSQPTKSTGNLRVLAADNNSVANQLIDWHTSTQEDPSVHQTLKPEGHSDSQPEENDSAFVDQQYHSKNVKSPQVDDQSEHGNSTILQENLSTDGRQVQKDLVVEKDLVSSSQENSAQDSRNDRLQHSEDQQEVSVQQLNDQQTSSDQTNNQMKRMKTVPFNMLIPILRPHLDKDRSMQLDAVFGKLRSNEISKENFLRVIRNIVGDQMLRQAVQKLQAQISSSQRQMQSSQQQVPRSSQQFVDGHPNSQLLSTMTQRADACTDLNKAKSNEVDSQSDKEKHDPVQMSSSNISVVKQERDISLVSVQQQQLPSSSLSHYSSAVNFNSQMFPRPHGIAAVASRKSQTQGSQIRQLTPQGILCTQTGAAQPMSISNASRYEVQNTVTDTNRHGASVPQFAGHLSTLQSQAAWQTSASKEQKTSTSSPMSFVKQEALGQTNEQQSRPNFGAVHVEQGSPAPNSSKGGMDEKQASRISLSSSTTTVVANQIHDSVTSQSDPGTQVRSQILSTPLPVLSGTSAKTPPKKPSTGQKKPLDSQVTPPPASKKQKASGAYLDQSIEQLNDVTAVSGVNLREEEEQLLSAPKEESRASEATRRAVQEEEEKLILVKGPLRRKLVEIMSKSGIKNASNEVERCLSLCVEERLRGLISNLIRVSRQRVDIEKARHRIVFTSDVRRQISMMNKRVKEEWERKQAEEAEKHRKQNEGEGISGGDAEKEKDDGGRSKSLKSTKEDDDKMRTTAANVAARAAVGGDDMLSKWQLMAEQARQKREGALDMASGTLPGRTTNRKQMSNIGRTLKENQEGEVKSSSVASMVGGMRKFGRMVPHPKVVRSITPKDIVSVLEREPQMSKSSLLYRLCDRISTNVPVE